jgi:hypothetical protein
VARRVLATCSKRSTSRPSAAGLGQRPLPVGGESGGPDTRSARDPLSSFVPHSDHLIHLLSILSSGSRPPPMKKRRHEACVFLSGFLCFFQALRVSPAQPARRTYQ